MPYVPEKFSGKNQKKRATKWEKKLAKDLKMKTTSGSGAGVYDKADLKGGLFRGESKKTEQESISLRRDWLEKVEHHANENGEDWFLHIGFTDISDNPLFNCVVISEKLFKILKDIMETENGVD